MTITSTHPEYSKRLPQWTKIKDICEEENLAQYLIELNPADTSDENKARNKQYRARAIFHAISGATVQGMLGSVFRKWPTLQVPAQLEYVKTNADGSGVSIYQSSQKAVDDVVKYGRAGLAVTFPQSDRQISAADIQSGKMVATMHLFAPTEIINWRTRTIGSKTLLSLVVTKEREERIGADGYAVDYEDVYREKFLVWPRDEDGKENLDAQPTYYERKHVHAINSTPEAGEAYAPLDADGKTWDIIPFAFIGSRDNTPETDHPPMLGIVNLNIGLFRNSADYEDSVWFSGQAQPWMSGLTQEHIDLMAKNNMYVGGNRLMAVPEGGAYGYAQANPNPMVRQAMLDKVDSMIQLGARMMQVGSAAKTAEQAAGEREAQTSLLAMIASNVSEAYTLALQWAARYMIRGEVSADEISYTLSQDFVNVKLDPQELREVMAGFLQGTMPVGDYTRYMKKKELFEDDKTEEDYADLLARPGIE